MKTKKIARVAALILAGALTTAAPYAGVLISADARGEYDVKDVPHAYRF